MALNSAENRFWHVAQLLIFYVDICISNWNISNILSNTFSLYAFRKRYISIKFVILILNQNHNFTKFINHFCLHSCNWKRASKDTLNISLQNSQIKSSKNEFQNYKYLQIKCWKSFCRIFRVYFYGLGSIAVKQFYLLYIYI